MKFARIWVLMLVVALSAAPFADANNFALSNVSLDSQSTSADTVTLEFDVSWDNSWRDSVNRDAAWVFVKFSTDSGTSWNHATMKTAGTNPSGFDQGSGTGIDIKVPTDKKGCFVERSALGSGTLSTTGIQIVWDYAADGIGDDVATSQAMNYRVYGIEMVYVSEGGFYAGDGTNGTNSEFLWEASIPGTINTEATEMPFGSTAGAAASWYYTTDSGSDDDATGTVFNISASFPKGYQAIYVMKYEITEGQWAAFFNTLTSAQQTSRDITAASGKNSDATVNRNTIAWSSGNATTTRTDRACSYLSWMDLCAYADWAALRPMSELEFEKACRGPIYPVTGEYAWGSTSITAPATISGTEDGTEYITTASANANYNAVTFSGGDGSTGPLRAGIFATSSTNTRVLSGGSYYGVMDLTGNLWERTVTVGNAAGRGFAGTHGDGVLTSTASYEGNATNPDWPGLDSTSNARGLTGASGSGFRGGSWNVSAANAVRLRASGRYNAGTTTATRIDDNGGRCVRTAP